MEGPRDTPCIISYIETWRRGVGQGVDDTNSTTEIVVRGDVCARIEDVEVRAREDEEAVQETGEDVRHLVLSITKSER